MNALLVSIVNFKIRPGMNKKKLMNRTMRSRKNSILAISILALCYGCQKSNVDQKELRDFKQVNLVANTAEYHPVTIDPTLLNGFGMAWSSTGVAWVNSVGGHVSELYSAEGDIVRKPVNIPSPTESVGGFPTGIVFSGGKGFNLDNGPSVFLFTGFDGVLSGWNGASGDFAKRLRTPANAAYTGLAIGASGSKNFIYGANFGASKIDVWDTTFTQVNMSFKDPTLPAEYSPYNIQAVGDLLFVIYAKLGADGHPVKGSGNGYVSIFNTDGSFVKRFASQGTLNIPWGVTAAPASFLENRDMNDGMNDHGRYGNVDDNKDENYSKTGPVILVGNFGDGRINVYNVDGKFLGQLQSHKSPIEIDGLWALSFAPSTATHIDPARLYFTAGPDNETDGLFGYLIK
jgi:uncharacterized protein (TIGR03118 family)